MSILNWFRLTGGKIFKEQQRSLREDINWTFVALLQECNNFISSFHPAKPLLYQLLPRVISFSVWNGLRCTCLTSTADSNCYIAQWARYTCNASFPSFIGHCTFHTRMVHLIWGIAHCTQYTRAFNLLSFFLHCSLCTCEVMAWYLIHAITLQCWRFSSKSRWRSQIWFTTRALRCNCTWHG